MEELEARNFRSTIFLNEQEWEWQSLFTSYDQQQKLPNRRRGKEIPSLSIAGGYPFHFTSLQDATGTYYGTTDTNGSVIFDLFHKERHVDPETRSVVSLSLPRRRARGYEAQERR